MKIKIVCAALILATLAFAGQHRPKIVILQPMDEQSALQAVEDKMGEGFTSFRLVKVRGGSTWTVEAEKE